MKKQQSDNFTKEQEEVEVIMMNNLPLDNSFEWREEVAKEIIDKVLKSSLQSQREAILEEIEKKIEELGIQADKADTQIQNEDFNEFFSKEDAEKLIHDNLIIIKALEDIKQLLK